MIASTSMTCFIPLAPTVTRSLHSLTRSSCSQRPRRHQNAAISCHTHDPQHLESSHAFIPISGTQSQNASYGDQEQQSPWTQEYSSPSFDGDIPGGTINNNNRGSSGSGGSGDENSDSNEDSLPDDMKAALAYGSLTLDAVKRYKNGLKNPLLKLLLSIPAFRGRFLMDASFLFKLLAQEIIGNGTALAGEIAVRGKDIFQELEYVASDLIVGTVIEATFVWLLVPTLTLPTPASASFITKFINKLPAHVFQPATVLQPFSTSQRIVAFFYTAAQYAGIGFVGGVVGTAITYGLLEGRKLIDKEYKPHRPMPAVIPNALGWAAFMGASCNTRFQMVEGLEMGVAKMMAGKSEKVVNSAIIALRFLNNYYGGIQFVEFFRAIGLHATGDDHGQENEPKKGAD